MSMIQLKDNNTSDRELSDLELKLLSPIAGKSVKMLVEQNKGLWVFPQSVGDNGDEIGEQSIVEIFGRRLKSGNVVGFLGIDDVSVQIRSRFDNNKKQYFLHRMLEKVLGVNIVNMTTESDRESIGNYLIYIFPYMLKRAIRQGMFRAYRSFARNDDRVRGVIDIGRFIKCDIPFGGKIAYRSREYTENNHINHLIRHVIEYIRSRNNIAYILEKDEETRIAVRRIVDATNDYAYSQRRQIIMRNLRPVRHPYLTEITGLQKLCVQILRQDKSSFGKSESRINGILFDAAWLWEEYLAAIMPSSVTHPRNKTGENAWFLYKDRRVKCYPDFVGSTFIADAKYKYGENGVLREDRYQVISYLHVMEKDRGILIYPTFNSAASNRYEKEGILAGMGGEIGIYCFGVPQEMPDYESFNNVIEKSDEELRGCIERMVKKCNDAKWIIR